MKTMQKLSHNKLNVLGNLLKYKSLFVVAFYITIVITIYFQITANIYKTSDFSELSFEKFPITFKLKNLQNDENILNDKNVKKIFFIETHLNLFRKIDNPRQACSVESAGENNLIFMIRLKGFCLFLVKSENYCAIFINKVKLTKYLIFKKILKIIKIFKKKLLIFSPNNLFFF